MNPETILIVEDEPDVLEVVSLLLEDAAYRVVQATSGEAALSALQVTRPDLIISDVLMQGMDGFAFFEQVRADADRSQIPFMFLTSLDQKTAVRQGMRLGADDYLTKPFEPEDLLSAVETRLARATQTRDYREQVSREQLERSYQALADRVAELEALHDIGVAISSTLDSEAILQLIVNRARSLVNASSCSVLLPDQETGELIFRAATDPIVGMRVPPGQGVAARALQQLTSLIVHDTAADPHHYGHRARVRHAHSLSACRPIIGRGSGYRSFVSGRQPAGAFQPTTLRSLSDTGQPGCDGPGECAFVRSRTGTARSGRISVRHCRDSQQDARL